VDKQRSVRLALDVPASVPEVSLLPGVHITTLKDELDRNPACWPTLHELLNLCYADIPTANPTPSVTFEEFERDMRDPALLFDGFFLAKAEERYVGLSFLATAGSPATLGQRVTGTHPEFRRRGIAMALKVHTMHYAIQHGYKRIITATNALNTGMLAVNQALGFEHWYTECRLHRSM
jgi:mycothiol synthase